MNLGEIVRTALGEIRQHKLRSTLTLLGIDLHQSYPSGRFPQMPFEESMGLYGNDKPDLRFGMHHVDLTDLLIEHDGGGVPFFQEITEKFKSGAFRRDLPAVQSRAGSRR